MVATAKPIAHGEAMTNYATKNERADLVKVNLLTEDLPYMGMWDEMVLHMNRYKQKFARKPIDKTSIRIEVSPSMNESDGWTIDDWRRFTEEFVDELDQVTKTPDGKHKNLTPTNIKNSQYFAALHYDAKSGIPHLHLMVNRIDKDGNINDCHFIGERAVAAAQTVNHRHGWKDPMEIREEHLQQITDDCMEILKLQPRFDWTDYETQLTKRGYKVKLQRDKKNVVRGYSVRMGNSTYKSSELGAGRNLMPSTIENTWRKLHPIQNQVQTPIAEQTRKPLDCKQSIIDRYATRQTPSMTQATPTATSTYYQQTFIIDGEPKMFSIPENVYKELDSNIEVPDNSNATHDDILKVAMLLFLGYVDAATQMSESFGGGGGTGTGWGKDKDEDDLEWARRCAKMVNWLCKPILRVRKRN
ncbi:MAG: relaxase/mobilization nuclease domain-containing protein [Bacteroidaceae bacterium]|nr:relaxase/mobilization nuclease domain-containing protein [Bacteroidaceae bacterium]